ncbi:MAG: hypothetical protein IJC90_07285 [Clostridia bacterium]|nr:hypothetical protein [Clostridia bacterium]
MSNELKALAKEFLEDISADFPNEKFESEEDCCNFWLESTKDITSEQYENLFNDTEKLLEKISNTKDEELLSLSENFFENYVMLKFCYNKFTPYQNAFEKIMKKSDRLENLKSHFDEHLEKVLNELFAFAESFSVDMSEEEKEKYYKCQELEIDLLKISTREASLNCRIVIIITTMQGITLNSNINFLKNRLLKRMVSECYNGSNIKELAEEAEVDEETIQKIVDEIKNENV